MLKKESIDLDRLLSEAMQAGCTTVREIKTPDRYAFITDAVSLLIAGEEGYIKIPLEVIPTFMENLKAATVTSIEYSENFPLVTKNEIARNKKLTYGDYQGKMYIAAEYCRK